MKRKPMHFYIPGTYSANEKAFTFCTHYVVKARITHLPWKVGCKLCKRRLRAKHPTVNVTMVRAGQELAKFVMKERRKRRC